MLRELRDWWRFLRCDRAVSVQALASMFKVAASGFDPLLKISKLCDWRGNGKTSEKRKAESVCLQYYRKRKRICSPDVSVFEKCSNSSTVTEGEYADDILGSLNTKDIIDGIPDPPLLDASENVVEDPLNNADVTVMLVASPSIQSREQGKCSLFHCDQQDICQRKADDAFEFQSHIESVQLNEGKVICMLNTEDLERPCNDDIFMQIHLPAFRPEIATTYFTDPLTSCANDKDSQEGPSEEKDPTLSFTPSHMDNPESSSDLDSALRHVGHTFEYESSDTKWMHPLDIVPGQNGVDTSITYSEMSLGTEVGTLEMIDPESMDSNPSSSHNNSDSGGVLPYFSDIEALIVQLDLEYAQGSCIISEVAKHQYKYSNRTIIRPEYIVCSSLIKSMSSSAFAMFYSRHFHYYIMKTEVIIGRSTDDTDGDIDLRKEGHNNMLSSRQATMKMESDGSFILKNIGKSSISINGNSIAHGQVSALSSSCLIEISGMNFLFEINERYKRQYLDHIIRELQGFDASSTISRLDESKGNEKSCEKRKGRSIHKQYYCKRKRIKDDFFNSGDHVTLNNEAQFSDAMFSDSLGNKFSFEETDFVDEGDPANSSTVTEGDIICSLNTEDTIDDIPDSQLLDSQGNVLEDSLCNADTATFYGDLQGVCHWKADAETCPSPSVTPQITSDIFSQLISADEKDGELELSAGKYPAPSFTDIINQSSLKLAVKWKNSEYTSASYSEISLQTEAGCHNNSISDHNNCYSDGDLPCLSDIKTSIHRMNMEYREESYIASEVELHPNIARMVKVEPSGFNPLSATSRLDDLKRNKKTHEKKEVGSIRIQYYRKRKRIKDDLFESPDLRFFKKCNSSTTVAEGEYADHPETIRSFETNDVVDRLTHDRTGVFDLSFDLKDDSANSSTVTEGDILCSLNTEDTMDDIPDSQLLNSSDYVPEDSLCNADGTTFLVATPRIECDEESKDSSFDCDQQNVCHWEAYMALTSITHLDTIQLSDGKVICNLNTEDSEIPCNDDIFMQIHRSSVIASDSIDPLFSSADVYYEFETAQPHIGYSITSESFDTKCLHPLFTNPMLIEDRVLTRDDQGLDSSATYSDMSLRTEVESLKIIYPESEDNYVSISDHNNSDSDNDLPSFSDIDALIHRIDLEYAEESYITSEVGGQRYNYSQRTVTRLEQTSLSSLQRAMSSLGALAVFYSRQFNYYIKKTEVTIGRSTKDTDVDIDLRKVGCGNMISRRQATIKMESEGSFTLKNLGKSSISMNGDSVAHGQVAALSSGCVIELSGMKFTFEINERQVRRYLENIIKESRGISRTFEWSPEDEP